MLCNGISLHSSLSRALLTHYCRTLDHIHEYGGDNQGIFLAGHSAGGHLVSLVTYDPSYMVARGVDQRKFQQSIKGLIGISGVYNINRLHDVHPLAPYANILAPGLRPFLILVAFADTSLIIQPLDLCQGTPILQPRQPFTSSQQIESRYCC